jgi:hypothetical protein
VRAPDPSPAASCDASGAISYLFGYWECLQKLCLRAVEGPATGKSLIMPFILARRWRAHGGILSSRGAAPYKVRPCFPRWWR